MAADERLPIIAPQYIESALVETGHILIACYNLNNKLVFLENGKGYERKTQLEGSLIGYVQFAPEIASIAIKQLITMLARMDINTAINLIKEIAEDTKAEEAKQKTEKPIIKKGG